MKKLLAAAGLAFVGAMILLSLAGFFPVPERHRSRPAQPVEAKGPPAVDPAVDPAAIDLIVYDALKTWQVPGVAVAIVRDDEVIYLKGFGVRKLGNPEAVTPDTLFPIASCTKAFTATALAMLVEDGKLNWDDPVRKHVDYFRLADPLANEQVTLRDLVCHRTGVGSNDFLWYRSPWSREEVIRRIGLVKAKHSFRSAFAYQTTMFTTAGAAVEKASGLPWEECVRQRICEPLGMTSVVFTTPAAQKSPDHASPHRQDAAGKTRVIPWYPLDVPEPAGSIHASVRDLSQWLRFQLGQGTVAGKRLISPAALAETHMPQTIIRFEGAALAMNPDTTHMSYGMGWVIQDYRGHQLVSHAGAIDGFRAHITLAPQDHLGIVLLNNLDQSQMNLPLSNTLVDLLLGLPYKNWNGIVREQMRQSESAERKRFQEWQAQRRPDAKPSHPLADYTGTYDDPAYGTVRITLENGILVWRWNSFQGPLQHHHGDTFTLANDVLGFPRVVFLPGAEGQAATMRIDAPLEVDFRKK